MYAKPKGIFLLALLFSFLILSLFFLTTSQYVQTLRLIQINPGSFDVEQNIPGSFLDQTVSVPSNVSYCDFRFGLPKELKWSTNDEDLGPELGQDSPYRIIYNVVSARIDPEVPAVTYATHVTADFMNYVPELVKYWDGMISIAAFVPHTDVAMVLEQLNQYCYCLPGMSRVSFHLVFHKDIQPSKKDIYFDRPMSCKVQDSSHLHTYRQSTKNVMYPINVCRNAARTAALTEDVMVSDIQLMPSEGLAARFLEMKDVYKLSDCRNRAFVLPIFEVEAVEKIPRTKKHLLNLVKMERAVYFHRMICTHCQKFPGIEAWMVSDPGKLVKPFITVKREVPYNRWEPIYIGTKNEPLYNEMLSWEGLQDKMLQMLEMCLIGYRFVILDGAFLIHWPGMKKTKTKVAEAWRDYFVKENSKYYKTILEKLVKKYDPKPQCKLQ